jgi:hypothetical protein
MPEDGIGTWRIDKMKQGFSLGFDHSNKLTLRIRFLLISGMKLFGHSPKRQSVERRRNRVNGFSQIHLDLQPMGV